MVEIIQLFIRVQYAIARCGGTSLYMFNVLSIDVRFITIAKHLVEV
jgi:hypothetical protein